MRASSLMPLTLRARFCLGNNVPLRQFVRGIVSGSTQCLAIDNLATVRSSWDCGGVTWSSYRCFTSVPIRDPSSEFLRYLIQRIKATGPLTVAEYMKECATNPLYGYYSRRNPIGREGDFITSPEVCQIFGELLALWIVNEWSFSGGPAPFQVVELGPGTGTLASDVLRILVGFPQMRNQFSLHLVERSQELAETQAKRLGVQDESPVNDKSSNSYRHGFSSFGVPVSWYLRIEDIPKETAYILANEFFDALPLHKLQRTPRGLREVLIDLDEQRQGLRFVLASQATPVTRLIPSTHKNRVHLEFSPESSVVLENIADRVGDCGGGALVIDYGHEGTKGDTLRGFRRHQVVDVLDQPGSTDLTADVDFSLLKSLLRSKVVPYGPIPQFQFLTNLAFEQRFKALLRACKTTEEEKRLAKACDLLINPEKMGGQFFVMGITDTKRYSQGPLTGFS